VLAALCKLWISILLSGLLSMPGAVCVCGAGDGVHIMTGPIYVCGAEPGDILQVDILDLQPRKNPATGKVQPVLS
jgi:hypothetical protein